jgi:hypothetical protein
MKSQDSWLASFITFPLNRSYEHLEAMVHARKLGLEGIVSKRRRTDRPPILKDCLPVEARE